MPLNAVDLSNVNQTIQGGYQTPFWLTDMEDSSTLEIATGSYERVSAALYVSETSPTPVVDSATDGSNRYIYLVPSGSILTPTLKDIVPTFDSDRGGYYNGAEKAAFKLVKSGTNYSRKQRLGAVDGSIVSGDLAILGDTTIDGNISGGGTIYSGALPLTYQTQIDPPSLVGTGVFQTIASLSIPTNGIYTISYAIKFHRMLPSDIRDVTLSKNATAEDDVFMTVQTPLSAINESPFRSKTIAVTSAPESYYLIVRNFPGETYECSTVTIRAERK